MNHHIRESSYPERLSDRLNKQYLGVFSEKQVADQIRSSFDEPTVVIGIGAAGSSAPKVLRSLAAAARSPLFIPGYRLKSIRTTHDAGSKEAWLERKACFYEEYIDEIKSGLAKTGLTFVYDNKFDVDARNQQVANMMQAGAKNILGIVFDASPETIVRRTANTKNIARARLIGEEVIGTAAEGSFTQLMVVDANAKDFPRSGLPIYL